MKVPPKRKGNQGRLLRKFQHRPLNESPSEKEGKYVLQVKLMPCAQTLNESPSEKEGKYSISAAPICPRIALNESPSEKEGKFRRRAHI